MSVLTKQEILKEIKNRNIIITPLKKDQIGPGSVDLHLANQFRVFKKVEKPVHVNDKTDPRDYTKKVTVKDHILLMPGETIQGITKERIKVAPNLCAWLEGRSRFARLGLLVHISASFMQPGFDNKQVLEISNMSNMPMALYPGTRICQMIFERCEGKATYKGKYSKQNSV
ncbi:MAG: dCTP deaminase [Candidatus Woesearchaeota archaeon]